MDILTQQLAQKAINSLGIDNYCLYGIPSNEDEYYEMFKPVIYNNLTGVVYYKKDQYPFTFESFIEEYHKVNEDYKLTQYQRLRAPEYPSITDQLDALFHAGVFPPEMAAQIQAIKDKYPKSE